MHLVLLLVMLCRAVQTVAHARMEQQLYGSSSRSREDDSRVISGKSRSLTGALTQQGAGTHTSHKQRMQVAIRGKQAAGWSGGCRHTSWS